jgi:hypothetical protein
MVVKTRLKDATADFVRGGRSSTHSKGLRSIVAVQLAEMRRFAKSKTIRTALLVPWAEAFTVAFALPVFPFFMQELHITPSMMGQLRTVHLLLQVFSAPVAGSLLDAYGPFLGIALPASICAIGCAIRSLSIDTSGLFAANVFSGLSGAKTDMAIAHLSRHTEPSRRTLAVSAAKVQLQALTLLGTACFTPLNALLIVLLPASTYGLLRFRLFLSLCTLGCGFGVIVLLCSASSMSYEATPDPEGDVRVVEKGAPLEQGAICASTTDLGDGASETSESAVLDGSGSPSGGAGATLAGCDRPTDGRCGCGCGCGCGWTVPSARHGAILALAQVALFVNVLFRDTLGLVWPLYLKAHFGWAEMEYGMLLPVQQALAFALVATPRLQEALGTRAVVGVLGVGSTVAYALSMALRTPTPLVQGAHVAFFLLGGVCGSALEVVLTSLSSVFVPPRAQGRLFAGLLLVKLGGSVVGNLVGTALFQTSMDATSGPWLLRGGALPIEAFALPALINLAGLVCVLPQALDAATARAKSGHQSVLVSDDE